MIFVDYDLMYEKCLSCNDKEKIKLEYFKDKEVCLCTRTNLVIENYEKYEENLCLKCFEDFQIQYTDLEPYSNIHFVETKS